MNKLKINLKDLRAFPEQKCHLVYRESIDGWEMTEPAVGNITLAAYATSIRLTGKIQAKTSLSCHRCLDCYWQSIDLDLNEEFVYEDYLNVKTLQGRERELQKEDFFETVPYDGAIDVSDVVYQAITLAIPNYCVCGPHCSGLPTYNQKNTVKSQKGSAIDTKVQPLVDPRWHNLKTIFSNDTQNKKVRDNT